MASASKITSVLPVIVALSGVGEVVSTVKVLDALLSFPAASVNFTE